MDEPSPAAICQWVTCPSPVLPGGYLCETHLAKVLHGRSNLRMTFKEIVLGLGVGIAGNALYQALAILPSLSGPAFADRGRLRDYGRPPLVRPGAYTSEEQVEQELDEIEELSGFDPAWRDLAYDRLIEFLSAKAGPNA